MMNSWLLWIIVAIATVSISIGLKLGTNVFTSPPQFHSAQLFPTPKALIDFKLEKNKTEEFTAQNFFGQWSLVFFGFTHCPDFCPLELQKMAKLSQMAQQADQYRFPLKVIFISLDPERDTSEKIKTYTAFFHPQIQGLSGSNTELAKIAHFFGADYSRNAIRAGTALSIPAGVDMPSNIEIDYQVNHSARIYILNPQSVYIGSFAPPHNVEHLWSDLQVIMSKYKPAAM